MTEPGGGRRGPVAPLPLTVLTGFLGAGKTTLLNRLLKDTALADTAVVVADAREEFAREFVLPVLQAGALY